VNGQRTATATQYPSFLYGDNMWTIGQPIDHGLGQGKHLIRVSFPFLSRHLLMLQQVFLRLFGTKDMAMSSLVETHRIAGRMKTDKISIITPEMIAYSALMVSSSFMYFYLC
jgi:hypothetical protein